MHDSKRHDSEVQDLTRYFAGHELYGDDFTGEQIEQWYRQEEHGYYSLMQDYYHPTDDYEYAYHALNDYHAFSQITGKRFRHCLTIGCANGDDIAPIAGQVDKFLAIEPAEQWWAEAIGGTPAVFVKPQPSGRIDAPDGEFDLCTCFGVLHHIPNVSSVLEEIGRVMAPGGIFLLREPISTMGNWNESRPGLTQNERGIPFDWLSSKAVEAGFRIDRTGLCFFPPLIRLAGRAGIRPFASAPIVALDAMLSKLFRFNIHYHRNSFAKKIAPASVFFVLVRKQ